MEYIADAARYGAMEYRKCGESGLRLPAMSLGLWHNFGTDSIFSNCREMVLGAFDSGITHFDLANNYGPVPGSAEETFGRILSMDLRPYRDEIIVSTKAGYDMWPGPYGDHGSRKYLVASLDQSLRRMGLDYVDIFYHHRPDPDTPLEETMGALADIVHAGKALYVGISNYGPEDTRKACRMLREMGVHCLIDDQEAQGDCRQARGHACAHGARLGPCAEADGQRHPRRQEPLPDQGQPQGAGMRPLLRRGEQGDRRPYKEIGNGRGYRPWLRMGRQRRRHCLLCITSSSPARMPHTDRRRLYCRRAPSCRYSTPRAPWTVYPAPRA